MVRSWTDGESGEYSLEKMQKQFQGIYEPDWDVENQIVMAEPFMSYVVHDAVALAGQGRPPARSVPALVQFLAGGYDTIGECWGYGTHVHGWSCTPTKDMIFYTLGVTPAEPGYTVARIAPRLGRWPGPREGAHAARPDHRPRHAGAGDRRLAGAGDPVDLAGQPPQTLPAGRHEVKAG